MLIHAQYLKRAGYSSLAIDLGSFGESEGEKITFGSEEWRDVKAGYEFLKSKPELKEKPIGFLGISMGASSSILAAGKGQVGEFLIASSGYTSLDELLKQQVIIEGYPSFPFSYFMLLSRKILIPNANNAIDYADKIKMPTLIIHGTNDKDVSLSNAYAFEKKIPNSTLKVFEAEHDVHHGDPAGFEQTVLEFLAALSSQ